MKVLVVEDDSFLVSAYRTKLESQGFEIHAALDGKEALLELQKWTPDVVVLDLLLPNMDGFEFLTKMKADKRWTKIPVLVASNLNQDEDVKRAIGLGAAAYVVKSNMSLDDLIEKIKSLVPRKMYGG